MNVHYKENLIYTDGIQGVVTIHFIHGVKLFLKIHSRRISGLCSQNGTLCPAGCTFFFPQRPKPPHQEPTKLSQTGSRGRDHNCPSTQSLTFWAGDFRQMGKFLIAIVALAAAEKHLRVFFCGYTLLPAWGMDRHGNKGKRENNISQLQPLVFGSWPAPNRLLHVPSPAAELHRSAVSTYRKQLGTQVPQWIAKTLEKTVKETNASICIEGIRWWVINNSCHH